MHPTIESERSGTEASGKSPAVKFVNSPLIKPGALEERKYQVELAEICFSQNTLVVLPTGLGKTAIALLTIAKFLSTDIGSRCLLLAPTRVLVHQHYTFLLKCLDLPDGEIAFLTGEDPTAARDEIWSSKRLICATPQATVSDIERGKCDIGRFSLIVFDEVHRAIGNHAYTSIASLYQEFRKEKGRVLGITASLPSDRNKIDEIISKLQITKVEIKDETNEDVRPYTFKTNAQWIEVKLSPPISEIQRLVRDALDERLELFEDASILKRNRYGSITLKDLLRLRTRVDQIKSAQLRNALFSSIRLLHALNLIETQSISAFKAFMERLYERHRGYGMSELLRDRRITDAFEQARGALVAGVEHPKIGEVLKLCEQVKTGERAIVFASYRDTVDQIYTELVKHGLRAGYLIGKSGQTGQSQKKQVQALQDLRDGIYDILVATQVGEEGLDVAECKLVIFYDNVPSAVRFVQRRGRTGRRSEGKICVLITKGTKDEAYYWLSRRRLGETKKIASSLTGEERKGPMDDFFSQKGSGQDEEQSNAPAVVVDTREASQLADRLRARGARVDVRQLDIADFVLSSDIAVERKTYEDFTKSVFDGRLFKQLSAMGEKYARPILIVQGDRKRAVGMGEAAYYGALASVLSDFRIPVYFASDEKEVCEILFHIARREQLERNKQMRVREGRKPSAISEIQRYIVSGVPGVDAVLADRLLVELGTIERLFGADESELIRVEGIAEVMARRIRQLATAQYLPQGAATTPAISESTLVVPRGPMDEILRTGTVSKRLEERREQLIASREEIPSVAGSTDEKEKLIVERKIEKEGGGETSQDDFDDTNIPPPPID
jgi:ERCC4-related helicase